MLEQTQTNEDPRAKLAAFHRKQAEERQQVEQLQREAAAAEAAEQLQRQQEAERAELEARRRDRQTLEAYEGLSKQERAQFDQATDPVRTAQEYADQARRQLIDQFNQENEAQRLEEIKASRGKPGHNVIPLANEHARERAEAFNKKLEDAELQAERYDDPVRRIVMSLPEEARPIMSRLLDDRPSSLDTIQQVKQQSAANNREQLKAAYIAEMQQNVRSGFVPRHIAAQLRQKYTEQGLDPGANDVVTELTQAMRR